MKKAVIFSLISIMLLPMLLLSCKTSNTKVPAINGGQEAKIIDLMLDDFQTQNNIVKDVALVRPGHLIVRLGANPSTGYQWGEADISGTEIVAQESRQYVAPQNTKLVGAAGTDVWVFDSKAAGATKISFSYSRPWEGGEKNTFTLTINVTVQ